MAFSIYVLLNLKDEEQHYKFDDPKNGVHQMFSMLVENNKDICFYSSKKIFDGWQLGYNIVFFSLWNQSQIDSEYSSI